MTSTLPLRSPADVLAAVPYLLGFHPTDSLVVLGLRGSALVFQLRGDLPGHGEVGEFADYYARLVRRQRVPTALLIGYGEGAAVTPVVTATAQALNRYGIAVPDMLRAKDGRYWSYACTSPACCPPEGTPYDVSTSLIAAQATLSGCVALPSREELERRLAPVTGTARTAMRRATDRAAQRLADLVGRAAEVPGDMAVAGRTAVDRALTRHRAGQRLGDDEVAWLSVVLGCSLVREHAWRGVGGDLGAHVALWTDVLRRAQPELAAPPATLLALAAWRTGEGAIASIALARALHANPEDQIARLMDHALRHGMSPAEWEAEWEAELAPARPRMRPAPA